MRALIIVDAQYDFFTVTKEEYEAMLGGALAVPFSLEIIPVINKLLPKFDIIIFTKDWHPKDMECFMTVNGKNIMEDFTTSNGVVDKAWPAHCVEDTRGAEIHDDIDFSLIKGDFYIFKKGLAKDTHPYSGFGAEGLADFLREKGVTETVVVGLATDWCAGDTALDSVKEGFKTTLIWDGCRGIAEDLTPTLNKLFDAGVIVTDYETFNQSISKSKKVF